jgi:hypothetical protein
MAAPSEWATRTFQFTQPVEMYPNLLVRLRGTAPRMEEILRSVDEARIRRRPAEGKWSALERAGHLIEVEKLWQTRLAEYMSGAAELTPADMSNAATFAANYNEQQRDSVLARFREARGEFVGRLSLLKAEDFARTALHPRLKVPMRLLDGLYFTAEHDDHELAWMWELVQG